MSSNTNRAELIGAPRHAPDRISMAFEHAQAAPRLHLPQTHSSVIGGRERAELIGAPRHVPDPACAAFENAQAAPRFHLPLTHGLILTPRQNALSIWTEPVGPHSPRVV